MKELTIKRLINLDNYENVEFEATFERHWTLIHDNKIPIANEMLSEFIETSFREFSLVLKRAGINDKKISWRIDVND